MALCNFALELFMPEFSYYQENIIASLEKKILKGFGQGVKIIWQDYNDNDNYNDNERTNHEMRKWYNVWNDINPLDYSLFTNDYRK